MKKTLLILGTIIACCGSSFYVGFGFGAAEGCRVQEENVALRSQNETLSNQAGQASSRVVEVETTLAKTIAERFPGKVFPLADGENEGERYVRYFTYDGKRVYAQLKNDGLERMSPRFTILLLDKWGTVFRQYACHWAFNGLNPGEEKNESITWSPGIGGEPEFYTIVFE